METTGGRPHAGLSRALPPAWCMEFGVSGSQGGVGGVQVGVAGAEAGVVGFQAEDPGDAGEVDAVGDEDTDAAEPGDVGVAVPAGATLRAGGFEQAFAFVKP